MTWYNNIKIQQLEKEAMDWQGAKNNALIGGGMGVIALAISLWAAQTGRTEQEAKEYIGTSESLAHEIVRDAPEELVNQYSPTYNQQPIEQTKPQTRSNPYSSFIEHWEGRRNTVYTDTTGHKTIGVGFNLERSDAQEIINGIGLDFQSIYSGQQSLNDQQIDTLLAIDASNAEKAAMSVFPSFNNQPDEVKQILVDLTYNLGTRGIYGFPKFRAAIQNQDYATAAAELVDSKWYGQTGRRAKNHVSTLQRLQ